MGWITLVVFIGLVAYFALQRRGVNKTSTATRPMSNPPRSSSTSGSGVATASRVLSENMAYLKDQWAAAEKERDSGTTSTFPHWFFDAPTERQLERIKTDGLHVGGPGLTKGAASDLIGLALPVEDGDAEVLKFFKVPLKGLNQTRARYEVKRLPADAQNASAWNERPADPLQKECLKFFGIPAPRGLTCVQAAQIIDDHRTKLDEGSSKQADEWDSFESIVDQLSDKDTRDDFELKKPTLSAIRLAVDALLAEGKSMDDLDTGIELVAEKLIEMKPELAK